MNSVNNLKIGSDVYYKSIKTIINKTIEDDLNLMRLHKVKSRRTAMKRFKYYNYFLFNKSTEIRNIIPVLHSNINLYKTKIILRHVISNMLIKRVIVSHKLLYLKKN